MFNQNVLSLKKCNLKLADKLIGLSFDKARETVDIAKSKSDDVIFIKNNIPLESIDNPVEEAFYEVQSSIKSSMGAFDFIIIFGLGVGYMLDYIFEKYDSKIILIEPDINVMRTAFEMVDYSKYLESGRLFMTCDYEDVYKFLSKKYIINDKVEVVFLKQYMSLYADDIKTFTEKIYETCAIKISDINTIKKNSEAWVTSSIRFVKNSGQTYPISLLDKKFEGKTALVIGAGPSLKDNIDYIKKYSDRLVIFAINRAINFLLEHGVIPNFAIFTDTRYIKHTFNFNAPQLKDINFVVDIKADAELYNVLKKRCFVYYPNNFDLAKILAEKNSYVHLYQTAGTSTFCALICAKELGCKNVILSGVDLAFKNDTPYCSESYAVNLKVDKDKVKIGSMEKKIVLVKSVTGEPVKTREDYEIFIKQFQNFFKENPQIKAYNTSSFGAQIDGAINLNFEEVMSKLEIPFDNKSIEDIINDTLYRSDYNPVELKKEARNIVRNEEELNFEIRGSIKTLLNRDVDDEVFYVTSFTILDKISKTIFLSQLLQFELLNCTKLISQENTVQKRASFELFLEETLKKVDFINVRLAEI